MMASDKSMLALFASYFRYHPDMYLHTFMRNLCGLSWAALSF